VHDKAGEVFPDTLKGINSSGGKGLFIVCPRHAQIRLVRKHLSSSMQRYYSPFVDTVDKMQGQESQVVISSYGVSDIETALSEANFFTR